MIDNVTPVFEWLKDNWVVVALVVSEVAALLPGKAKGIIDMILKIGKAIFESKSNNVKK
jgi:hypothetical protein